jgi:glycosyltransferase involved in cell wall biosynthesis
MTKADLHVHSRYSDKPTGWLLKQLQAQESYSDPEFLFKLARRRGMDWVTITDHNEIAGSLELCAKHPHRAFTGLEATALFPEDGCPVHILVWGLNEAQFSLIQKTRHDLYQLRDLLRTENLAHAVAHPTCPVSDRLSLAHLEKLMVLFDVFEGINGGRDHRSNQIWVDTASAMTPERLDDLARKHHLEPWGERSWVKAFTGGSDDHAGLFAGCTFTEAQADDAGSFLACLRNKAHQPGGRSSNYQSLAFTIAKVVQDHRAEHDPKAGRSAFGRVAQALADGDGSKHPEAESHGSGKKHNHKAIAELVELWQRLERHKQAAIDDKLTMVYDALANISDDVLAHLVKSFSGLKAGNLHGVGKALSQLLPVGAMYLSFFASARHLQKARGLLDELRSSVGLAPRLQRVLWFTDTLVDLNGAAATLRGIAGAAHQRGLDVQLVTALPDDLGDEHLPPNVVNLPTIQALKLPHYDRLTLRFPSLLRSLQQVCDLEPDVVYISTPGPIGLLGLLVARVLRIQAVGFYHTDFERQTQAITGDDSLAGLLARYSRWFYGAMDEVRAPTEEYGRILAAQGLDPARISRFPHGLDVAQFIPREDERTFLRARLRVPPGPLLLYVGRISQDKDLAFLASVYRDVSSYRPDANLLIVGDGPYLEELKRQLRPYPRVIFTGGLPRERLPRIYAAADLFLFPSTTDTFGMAVLEAQACGVPALVSNVGGPQEVIVDGVTGHTVQARDQDAWVSQTMQAINMLDAMPARYRQMRARARDHAVAHYGWDTAMRQLFPASAAPTAEPAPSLEAVPVAQAVAACV